MAPSTTSGTRADVALLLRRAGFGARPEELDAATALGYEGAVDMVLAGLEQADPAGDAVPAPTFTPIDGRDAKGDASARNAVRKQRLAEGQALERWWLARMVATTTPAREKLTLFWHGHFATSIEKVRFPQLMFRQNGLLRSAGTGDFEALVQRVAQDPAMLVWLDAASNKKAHANENFARELMELFTLGIGNYSEDDVREAARCFTGWRLDRGYAFAVDQGQHDGGLKTVLGQTGPFGGEDVVRIVTHHRACAPFVASRIWSHYARPAGPDDPVVAELAAGFARDLNVANLLRAVFLHPEFRTDATRSGLVKTPIEYVVGTLRTLGGRGDEAGLHGVLDSLGQLPFAPPSVAGWPQNTYWLSTASCLSRLRFAEQVAQRADVAAVAAAKPGDRPAVVAQMLSVPAWSGPTAAALAGARNDPRLLLTLALVSPEWVLA